MDKDQTKLTPEEESRAEEEELTDIITAEDIVEQTAYVANAPDDCTDAEHAENMLGMLGATVIDPEVFEEEDDGLVEVTQEEADVKCAKHVLWLHDAGGEQADFSGCKLTDVTLRNRNLIDANFEGASLTHVNLYDAELCYAHFKGAKLRGCNISYAVAEEADFSDTHIAESNMDRAIFSHSNFARSNFVTSHANRACFHKCCFEDAEHTGGLEIIADMSDVGYDEDEWLTEQGFKIGDIQ